MGFGQFTTLLLQSASFLVQLVLVLISTGGSTRFRNTRTYFMMANFALAVVGSTLVRQRPAADKWTRFAGYCVGMAYSANFPLVMSLMSGNFGGFTKKVTVNAIVSLLHPLPSVATLNMLLACFDSPSSPTARATLSARSSSWSARRRLTRLASWP